MDGKHVLGVPITVQVSDPSQSDSAGASGLGGFSSLDNTANASAVDADGEPATQKIPRNFVFPTGAVQDVDAFVGGSNGSAASGFGSNPQGGQGAGRRRAESDDGLDSDEDTARRRAGGRLGFSSGPAGGDTAKSVASEIAAMNAQSSSGPTSEQLQQAGAFVPGQGLPPPTTAMAIRGAPGLGGMTAAGSLVSLN